MRTLKYILIGQTPTPIDDTLEWARWFESSDESRIVFQTVLGEECDILVSTIFLGLDHNFAMVGPPLLFETMIFRVGKDRKKSMGYQTRCSTWLQAEKMHERAVRKVLRGAFAKIKR